jgi:hypothetical protein
MKPNQGVSCIATNCVVAIEEIAASWPSLISVDVNMNLVGCSANRQAIIVAGGETPANGEEY